MCCVMLPFRGKAASDDLCLQWIFNLITRGKEKMSENDWIRANRLLASIRNERYNKKKTSGQFQLMRTPDDLGLTLQDFRQGLKPNVP